MNFFESFLKFLEKNKNYTEDDIRLRAYFLWEEAGKPNNQEDFFWNKAEDELKKIKVKLKTIEV